MRAKIELDARRIVLLHRIQVYEAYRDQCIAIKSRHGVIDAEADIREFEAQIAVIDWMLE